VVQPVSIKVWDVPGPIQCRLIGVTLSHKDGEAILDKFGVEASPGDCRAYHVHQVLLNHLASRNPVSIHVQKVLKRRLDRHRQALADLSAEGLLEAIASGDRGRGPIGGLIWAALNAPDAPENMGERLFAVVHMREHRALAENFEVQPEDDSGVDQAVVIEELGTRVKRQAAQIDRLRARLKKTTEDNRGLKASLAAARRQNEETARLKEDLADRQKDKTLIARLRREIEFLSEEIGLLLTEAGRDVNHGPDQDGLPLSIETRPCSSPDANRPADCPFRAAGSGLPGKKVALVGGLTSLVPHIRRFVEDRGGALDVHTGHSLKGRTGLEKVVAKADVVLCPVDVNSHFACKQVKKCCRSKNKPCLFMPSSGLSSVRKTLVRFAGEHWRPAGPDSIPTPDHDAER
jgi:uncharacterized coiled-coil protein SlyX